MKPKLLITRDDVPRITPAFEILEQVFEIISWPSSSQGRMPRKDFLQKLEGCAALFCTPHDIVDKEALDSNRGALQVIATVSVGYDHLHLDEIKKRGIRIGFVGDTRSSEAVAEFNVGLAIAASREFQQSRSFITSGDWFSKQTSSLITNIRGLGSSVVGIVGLGKIGLATAKILRAFQVSRVLYTSRVEKEEGKELDAEFVSLDTLCKESDFIFVTCALTNETEGLIGRNQFGCDSINLLRRGKSLEHTCGKMKPKLLITRDDYPKVNPSNEVLEEMFEIVYWPAHKGRMPREEFLKELEGCSALHCNPHQIVDREALDRNGGALRVIATYSVGFDHLHLDEIKKRGIRVGSVGDCQSDAVAEFSIGLAIAASRQFQQSRRYITSGDWQSIQAEVPYREIRSMKSSVAGIVGLGKIGVATAKLLKAFQVSQILYTSRKEKQEGKELGAELVPLDTLCKESDFIFVTCALTKETEGLIGRRQFSLMKSSAILINTSRGRVLDQDALIETLRQNKIAGAGLDVMIPEPLPGDHPLCKLDNCIVTPHASSSTIDLRTTMSEITDQNIIRGFKGEPMLHEL